MVNEIGYDVPQKVVSLKEIINRTGYNFIHGTTSGMVTWEGEPSPDEYRHRQPPPINWEDKIKFCLDNHPPLSVGRVISGNQRTSKELWSPVGLILSDGEIVGTGGHITGPDGKLKQLEGENNFPYPPDISLPDFNKGPYSVYEIGVENPRFSAIYVCTDALKYLGDSTDYNDLEAKAAKIASEHNLRLALIDENGEITYRS
ncbi:MAG: hypothetical protein HYV90_03900 [Candidatus Woesebacteria bacterium]|nr:MAG: hypothetical protein HYV90_03900 [Candidatus Woesebacteria bacterium]